MEIICPYIILFGYDTEHMLENYQMKIFCHIQIDKYQNIPGVCYLANVGDTRCTPTNRVLGLWEVVQYQSLL